MVINMSSIRRSAAILVSVLLWCAGYITVSATAASPDTGHLYMAHYENVLGTSLEMKVVAPSESQADAAFNAALTEIDREAQILSSWDANSEFSRWFHTQGRPMPVSPELFDVLNLFDQWRARTNGALDASAEAVTRIWQKAAAEERLPTDAEREAAVASIKKKQWTLDFQNQTATHTSDTPLALNSFVKSYIIEKSADAAMRTSGVRGVIVNVGGDLFVRGELKEYVDVADPKSDAENSAPVATLEIRNRAVATSGDYRRGFEINRQHYSHIVDPRTGMTAEQIISSTVVAPVAADAGALATAFSVLTPEESKKLAAKIPGVEFMLIEKDGAVVTSEGWSAMLAPEKPIIAQHQAPVFKNVSVDSKNTDWNQNYELTVGFTINFVQGFRITRPYVAIWIEDPEGHPVRTVALWFDKFRFLHELNTWYGDQLAYRTDGASTLARTVSSATRPAGQYTVVWDGKDDTGKLVPAGKYVIFVEASREHGTHQWVKQEVDFNGTPKRMDLQGGVEAGSIYIDYHKINH